MVGELIKRLRRISDGVIYPYSDRLAQSLGMEIVMCDAQNQVQEVIGEVGSRGVYGRTFVGQPVGEDEAQARLQTPSQQPPQSKKRRGRPKSATPGAPNVPLGTGVHPPSVSIGEGFPNGPDNSDLG